MSAGAVIGDAAEQAMDFLSKIDKRRYCGLASVEERGERKVLDYIQEIGSAYNGTLTAL